MRYLLKEKENSDNQVDSINPEYEKLKKDLVKLRKYLDYKNSGFCKKKLENIIKNYFKN